ncbi:OB-fold domain-containing protein [Nocardia nova]|uniref:OB-fold domain-containing protein n=1 Tax=Nocardia nova TaxID=37330 RepID=UPI00046D1870|nr:OB-fold domain-containing protein [Nocardia nova]
MSGVRCSSCERAYFPPIGLGCEVCGAGADELVSASLPAAGVVHAVADVHVAPQGAVPFTVAEVLLDGGPLIRAVVHADSRRPEIGDRVAARWQVVERGDSQNEIVEPAFEVVAAAGEVRS